MTPPIIGKSSQIAEIRKLIKNVSSTYLNILITGETGVGKGVVAKQLHLASAKKNKPFVTVNCAALPETLLESELYGYAKGAFTGAQKVRKGKFLMADSGILFLDEIGDMPIALQSKILHVLQTGTFSPLGSDQELRSDVWLIAATNHDLEEKIKRKTFRADLYYRLNIIKIDIPPLRARAEDIPLLVEFYISRYFDQFPERQIESPSAAVLERLSSFSWPGNIRQLQNIIKKQMVVNNWDLLLDELKAAENDNFTLDISQNKGAECELERNESSSGDFQGEASTVSTSQRRQHKNYQRRKGDIPPDSILNEFITAGENLEKLNGDFSLKKIKKKVVSRVEREVIGYVLNKTAWNRSQASKILKVSYKTLLTKIAELDLKPPS